MLLGVVTQAMMHAPHPVQASPSTGRPISSRWIAGYPAGQTCAQTPHGVSCHGRQVVSSIEMVAIRTPRHIVSGTVSASVGQAAAHGISRHITQACEAGRITDP
mgnify:FL=1